MGKTKWTAGALTLGLMAIIGAVMVWGFGSMMVAPTPSDVAPAISPARDVALRAGDGVALRGTYWPGRAPRAPGILLLHGNGASRGAMHHLGVWLSGLGYGVLAIDFRGHGQSAGAPHSFGLFESRDAVAALGWLRRQQNGAKIGVVGVSLGGAASLIGEHGPLKADAMVLQAVYPTIREATRNRMTTLIPLFAADMAEPLLSYQAVPRFGVWPGRLSPIAAIRQYRGPVLVIGGGADSYTPPTETRALYAAAPGVKQIWMAEGLDHAHVSGLNSEEYRAQLAQFFARWLGAP